MTTFSLKIIALITMIIDHTGKVLYHNFLFQNPVDPGFMRTIGRMAFPLYAFLIAEGGRHTKSKPKYMARLLLFALISEIPFDFLNQNLGQVSQDVIIYLNLDHQNVFFTLFLGAAATYIYDLIRERIIEDRWLVLFLSTIPAMLLSVLAKYCKTDYGANGVLMIYFIYVAKDFYLFFDKIKYRQLIPMVFFICLIYPIEANWHYTSINLMLKHNAFTVYALISAVLVLFYNGKKGPNVKYLFYIVYPAHLMILGFLWFFIFKEAMMMQM